MGALKRDANETRTYVSLILERIRSAEFQLESAVAELSRVQEECGQTGHTPSTLGLCEDCGLAVPAAKIA